jgi:hypothetical protein
VELLLATLRVVEGDLVPPDPEVEPWREWRTQGHHPQLANVEYTHQLDSLQQIEPDACGPDTDCHKIRRFVVWVAHKRRRHTRYRRRREDYVGKQLWDLMESGISELPPLEQLYNIELRVDVQRAVDSVPGVQPAVVWRWLQGETAREVAATTPGRFKGETCSHVTILTWLKRAWVHCRERLAAYGGDRRHYGGTPCVG